MTRSIVRTRLTAFFGAVVASCLIGCSTSTKYVEGTSTSLGTYIPYDGTVYGLEIVQYLSGCKVVCPTNQAMKVEREFCSSNSYFGIVHTTEKSKTKVEVQK